jgi:adenosylcobinamide kinase/adenosylcobinamide-phosphate guanylyltransferase
MNRITLITGRARSGKSRQALSLAMTYTTPRVFVATAEAFDDEMSQRIARHRAERAEDFITVEAPLDPATALRKITPDIQVLVLDCLTVWLGNLSHHYPEETESYTEVDSFLEFIEHPPCELVIVTNEVGMGIVPHNALARRFRDLAGTLNQQVAARADRVIFMVSGCALTVKETQ